MELTSADVVWLIVIVIAGTIAAYVGLKGKR